MATDNNERGTKLLSAGYEGGGFTIYAGTPRQQPRSTCTGHGWTGTMTRVWTPGAVT